MTGFSISRAVFAGFGLFRRYPAAVLAWWIAAFAFLVGTGVLGAAWVGEALKAMDEIQSSGQMDPVAMMEIAGETGAYSVVKSVLQVVFGAVLTSAVLRAFLRPVEKGVAFLGLGMQEFRLMMIGIFLTVIIMLGAGGVILVGAIFAAVMAASAGPGAAVIAVAISGVFSGIAALVLSVKFMLSAPQTVHEKALRVFPSWTLTGKRRFLKLIATVILVTLVTLPFAAAFVFLAGLVGYKLDGVSSLMPMVSYLSEAAFTVKEALSPGRLIVCALMALLWIVFLVLNLGAASSAYMQITGAEPVTVKATAIDHDDDDDDDDED